MLQIDCYQHLDFTSNTFVLGNTTSNNVYLVDIGVSDEIIKSLGSNQKIKGIFLTHAHYDHIYGINDITELFPDCTVYGSEYTLQGLYSDKMNLSFYHENPIVFLGKKIMLITEGMKIELYPNSYLKVLETPGHNKGSLSFVIENGIFTGDSLIPGCPVVTKLKSGNKEDGVKSILKIIQETQPSDILYPGHGASCKLSEIDINFYIGHDRN